MTNYERIEIIIKNNRGYITRKDINRNNIPSIYLSRFVKKNNLKKHCEGFYSLDDWFVDDYLVLQYKYPKLIFSFSSSSYLNKLGDSLPLKFEVTGPKNYRPFPLPNNLITLHTDTREEIYKLGIIELETPFSNKVKSYDLERTVCDFIRNREKIESEQFVKCVNYYIKRKDKDINKLIKYAKKMKIEDKVIKLMEVLLNEN